MAGERIFSSLYWLIFFTFYRMENFQFQNEFEPWKEKKRQLILEGTNSTGNVKCLPSESGTRARSE